MIRKRVPAVLLVVALVAACLPLAAQGPRWRPIGPDGASVEALAVGPGVVYAGTESSGVFKSTDGGGSWVEAGGGNQGLAIRGLALHPSDGDRVIAATLDGVFRTEDGGARWTRTGRFPAVAAVAAPSDPNVFYAGLQRVYRSGDGGATWTATGPGPDVAALAVDPADARTVYAGGAQGLFRSFDGGATWEASNAGLVSNGAPERVRVLAVDPRDPATVWAASTTRVFKSTNRGAAWSVVEVSPGRLTIPMSLAVDPASGTVWMGSRGFQGEGGVYRGMAGGTAWSKVFHDPAVQAVAVDPAAPGRLFVGSEVLGVLRSEDGGGDWEQSVQGLQALVVTDLEVDPRGPGRVFALASTNPGQAGRAVLRGDGRGSWDTVLGDAADESSAWLNDLAMAPGRPGTLYLGMEDGVRKSLDGGTTWVKRNEGFRAREWVSHVAVAPSDPEMVYALGWGSYPVCDVEDCPRVFLYRSEDGGASWTAAARLGGERPRALVVDRENPWAVYVGGTRLWKSLNGGADWEPGVRGPGGAAILSLAADPREPRTLYAGVYVGGGPRLWKSRNGGRTWRPASEGIPRSALVLRLVPDPAKPGTLYAATDQGVFVSRNRAGRWTPLRDGMTTSWVNSVAIDPRGGRGVYAGTDGGGGVFVLEGR